MRDAMNDTLDLTAAYASGRLPRPLRLLIDTQAAMERGVQAQAHTADIAGAAFLESITPAPMAADALQTALATIDRLPETTRRDRGAAARAAGQALQELIDLPEPLRSRALEAAETGGWRFGGPGLKRMAIDEDGDVKAELLRIEAGHGAPMHGHQGAEFTLVLAGAFSDGDREYCRGDVCIAGPGDLHRPIAKQGMTCMALAVTDAPLEFTGALGLMQRVFRLN